MNKYMSRKSKNRTANNNFNSKKYINYDTNCNNNRTDNWSNSFKMVL